MQYADIATLKSLIFRYITRDEFLQNLDLPSHHLQLHSLHPASVNSPQPIPEDHREIRNILSLLNLTQWPDLTMLSPVSTSPFLPLPAPLNPETQTYLSQPRALPNPRINFHHTSISNARALHYRPNLNNNSIADRHALARGRLHSDVAALGDNAV